MTDSRPLRILISGTTGDSMPPPYAGIPNVSLLYARTWKEMGHSVAVTFVYKPEHADDLGAGADYFFEYAGRTKPNKLQKIFFLVKYFFKNPRLYIHLFKKYTAVNPRMTLETILYSAYGVYMQGVVDVFKPDIILCQAALIKTFMVSEVARMQPTRIPVVYNTYAEVHDQAMGVNKHMPVEAQKKYWTYFLNLSVFVIGMDNCSVGPLMYLPPEKVKVFYDTCDFTSYQISLSESREELRVQFGLPQDFFLVAMMGAFHHRKGHDHLIKAVALLKKKGLKVVGVIVGGHVGLEKWIVLAKEEGVEDRMFFFQNFGEAEKVRLYKAVDAYANLSNSPRSCGLDLALLEAMSCGLPIVVYDNGALPSAVPHATDGRGKNGMIVKTGDREGVAEALRELANQTPEKIKEMGEESRMIASKTDIHLTAKIKIQWFREVLREK